MLLPDSFNHTYKIYHKEMKIFLLASLLLVASFSFEAISLTEDELDQQMGEGKHFWLVFRSGIFLDHLASVKNQGLINNVNSALTGFFKVAVVSGSG